MTHRELAEDLAITRDTRYIEVAMGSKWMTRPAPPIADVVVVRPSYTRFCIDIYEVKQSRADFLSDIRNGKWRSYLPFCHRFYFAAPSGIIKKEDVPAGHGLIIRGDIGWRVIQQAEARDAGDDIPKVALMSLLFYRPKLPINIARRQELNDYRYRYHDSVNKELKRKGKDLSDFISDHWYEIFKGGE
jgi:hypothetical protein